jgi:hypothetical protein
MLYQLKYDQGYDSKEEKEWKIGGTLIHLAMSYYYAGLMAVPPEWYQREDLNTGLERRGAGFPHRIQRAKEVMLQYRDFYTPDPDAWVPVATEKQFEASIGELDPGGPDKTLDDEIVTCKPDLVVSVSNPASFGPENWIVDFKTWRAEWGRNATGLEKWERKAQMKFALDWQVLFYLHIVRRHMPIKGFIIQRMLRDPVYGKFDFDRHILKIPQIAYERAPSEIRRCVRTEREIRRKLAAGIRPSQSFWACQQEFGPCDFFSVCSAEKPYEILQAQYVR